MSLLLKYGTSYQHQHLFLEQAILKSYKNGGFIHFLYLLFERKIVRRESTHEDKVILNGNSVTCNFYSMNFSIKTESFTNFQKILPIILFLWILHCLKILVKSAIEGQRKTKQWFIS